MHPLASISAGCLRQTTPVLALLVVTAAGPLRAQEGSSACRLLQVSELEAAIGGKVSAKPAGSRQAVPGMTMDECQLVLAGGGHTHPISIRIVSDLGMDGSQAIQDRNRGQAMETQWKVAGARLEQSTVGKAICMLTGRPNVASNTTCSIPRGKGYLEVDVTGPVTDLPSMAVVGALAQKAMSRL